MKLKSLLKVLMLSILCMGTMVEAKSSGGGGGSRSSSSSRSYSSPSPSRSSSSSWSKPSSTPTKQVAAPSSNSYSKPTTSGSAAQTSTRPTSKVDKQRYESAAKSGKAFTTREAAVADFKTKNASTYTSKYASEPGTRPDYIPRTYQYQGQRREVLYDQRYGGYGYWSGGSMGVGQFLIYDALADAAMTNTLMSRHNYYVGQPPARIGFWGVLGIFACVIVVVAFILALFKI